MLSLTRKQTIKAILSFLMILGWQVNYSQLIYYNSGLNIYSYDPSNCVSSFVIKPQKGFGDIAFDRQGNLYGCNTDLNRVYLSTGSVSKIADIGGTLNGMTISNEDIVYMGDPGGELISYDLNTKVLKYHGNMGYGCAGDFTFYKGQLYMAAFDNKIIKVNIEQPELSELVLTYVSSSDILGIVSDYRGCDDTRLYGLTGDTEVILLDLENLTGQFVCLIPLNVSGGASTTEFLASIPVTLGSPVVVQPDCKSLTGSVTFPNPSGMGALEFRLGTNAWQTETDFNNLSAGVYSFYLRDEKGCIDSLQIELKSYPLLMMDEVLSTPTSCNQADGELSVQASGGMGILTYSLNGFLFQLPAIFSGLTAGTYEVYVRDNSGCAISRTVEVDNSVSFNVHDYDLVNASCGLDNGAIIFQPDTMDTNQYMFAINGGAFQDESEFFDLANGWYHIVIKGEDGCQDTIDLLVGSSDTPELILSEIGPERCNLQNGFINAEVKNGHPPFLFRLNSDPWQSSQTFSQLQSGLHTIHVQDGFGCSDSLEVFVDKVEGPKIVAISTDPAQCNSANGRLEIDWESGDSSSVVTIFDKNMNQVYALDQMTAGDYSIVLVDSSGCRLEAKATIESIGCELFIPNVFSPNGDGVNDLFEVALQPSDSKRIISLVVFDRWGNEVFMSPQAANHHSVVAWDGRYHGTDCMPGVYTYRLILMDSDQSQSNLFGDITLIR